ncbi:N-acetylmuramic acid 6-phosphate etherase [Motilimonas eburnea]|uniref:N-acetylmuramic acid 6-phosphate etherase n=1 Tax=Motilimonas eburnea TaxID=1737488 RepID=UPI001E2F869E|nr:N-acetylmuramic acid 6-phosphate etherase [Motilimonas eburnea]MCE2572578.1 N-acetylmuramic acid 6-phosphate etherase [Motilimonas eburnea]
MSIKLQNLVTETRNPASEAIDTLSTIDMLKVINTEDKKVPAAVAKALPDIAQAVDVIAKALQTGARLIYVGAGTSGRLGILDASECPPTFGSDPNQVVGLIAGGHRAILAAVENAEDNLEQVQQDLAAINFNQQDVLVGIAASGRTPYVLGAMAYANRLGATTISVACNPDCEMAQLANIAICAVVGPEVVTGSSRMKAGTAQKLILNMLTTGAMIRIGKVYGNLMVDVEATNAKLVERQKNIVMAATECSRDIAEQALQAADGHCKTAIVMILAQLDAEQAKALLSSHQGFIRPCIV